MNINRNIFILGKDLRTKLFMQYSLTFYENLQICEFPLLANEQFTALKTL